MTAAGAGIVAFGLSDCPDMGDIWDKIRPFW